MATIHGCKVEVQYNQHYVSNSGNPVSAMVSQLQQQAQQQQQQIAVTKPIILNHTLSTGNAQITKENTMQQPQQTLHPLPPPPPQQSHQQQQQQQQYIEHQSIEVPKMWLLVEWEMPPNEPNTYSVIDTSELVFHGENGSRETIHTGKTIYVRRGKKIQQATVVIISDDKLFIDTELRQLRKMAADNHFRNVAAAAQNSSNRNAINSDHAKRRRLDTIVTSEEHEPASPEYEPMPLQSQLATANWVSNCKPERVMSPSPSVISMQMMQHAVPQPRPPPMTFDQQTQTDARFFPQENSNQQPLTDLSRILTLQETILAEQKSFRLENDYTRKIMYDIMDQVNTFAQTLKHFVSKADTVAKYEITEVKNPAENVSNYVVLGTGEEESRDHSPSEAETSSQKPGASNGSMVIDELSLQEDSNMSFNQSRACVQEDTSSATSTPKNLNFSKRLSGSALSLSNNSLHSQSCNAVNNSNRSSVNEVLKDWADEDGDDGELVSIGPNNSMVKKQVLRAINWTNYKAATRKLLMTLFSREVLASHTLTGRPSPAFMGDRAKPIKDKLDQRIIADIITIVTKTCNVSEPMVRTAITTKCADENKMSRMKSGKVVAQSTAVATPARKEDSLQCGQMQLPVSGTVPPTATVVNVTGYPRRIKRENKENFQ